MDRRHFLKSAGLLVGSLYASRRVFAHIKPEDRNSLIKGRVLSRKKGLPNVVVSDGFDTAITTRDGYFQLTTHQDAEFLFVSTPAGYHIEQESGFAAIYRNVNKKHYTFHLRELTADDTQHTFIGLGDPQVRVQEDVRQFEQESIPDMLAYVSTLDRSLVHGISVGDSIWDKPAMWVPYQRAVAKLGIPFFQTVGNHDKQEATTKQPDTSAGFKAHCGPTYYSFNRGKAHYVVLDNVNYQSIKDYTGEISPVQLDWLSKDLETVPKDHLLIVSAHIPVYNAVQNRDALYAILKPFSQVHILSGHTHQNTNHVSENIFEHTLASVCGAWWTGPLCTDGTPRGYAVFDVDGTDLRWIYKSIGKPIEYQFRSSVQKLNTGHRITVNIWNYDPDWKAVWYADGKLMGELEQTKTFDPYALSLYEGPDLPAERRGWVEARRTAHIFYAQTTAAEVDILVTDRFGETYRESLKLLEYS